MSRRGPASRPGRTRIRSLPAVTFVHGHLARDWPDLEGLEERDIDREPVRFRGGRNSWIAQGYLRLREALRARGLAVRLSDRIVPGTICIAHRDDANRFGGSVGDGLLVVVRADRPPAIACDFAIAQNGLSLGRRERFVPLWPQPGILPRDPARGTLVRRLGYRGRTESLPAWLADRAFHRALARRGFAFDVREWGWHDYRDVDVTLAGREALPAGLSAKPGTKVYNAWHAGTPVLAMPEPAYLELRRHPLDFLSIRGPVDVLQALERLARDPTLFRAMADHGRRRAAGFSVEAIRARWLDLFDRELLPAFERAGPAPLRNAWFLGTMAWQHLASRAWKARTDGSPAPRQRDWAPSTTCW